MTDIKKILPANQVISQLPDYNNLGRLTKLRLNLKDIPDLDWQLASELNTVPSLYRTTKIDNETTSMDQIASRMMAEVIMEPFKIKVD